MSLHSLPLMPTPFVGRENELAEITSLLTNPACRLVTLTGPGGIGKTRLAQEAARQQSFPDGIYFVPLQPLSSSEFIVPTIADSLKFPFYGTQDPKTQLLGYLCHKRLLLVMDNFEHLLEGADLLPEALEYARHIKILVTSRERLHLREEWVFVVGGLAFPESWHMAQIEDYDAAQLFVQHARRVGYAARAPDTPEVMQICQLVEGIPLAIELAAAWTHVMPCAEIAREIEHSLDILTTTVRNFPEKHRSMRAAFAHSWRLLSDEEKAVFTKMSVFRGGFRREAAEVVAGASLMTLAALVDKSLLRVGVDGRYDIQELLRQYGSEQLEASGAADGARDAHSRYYLELLHQRESDIKGRNQIEVLDEIEADRENIFTAWRWAIDHDDAEAISRGLETLHIYSHTRTREREVETLFRQAQERFSVERYPRVWGRIAVRRARLIVLGPFLRSRAFRDDVERCLAIAEEYEDPAEVALCKLILGPFLVMYEDARLDRERARTLGTEALATYESIGDPYYAALTLKWIGHMVPNLEGALAYRVKSLEAARTAGIANQVAWLYGDLGFDYFRLGRYADSANAFQQASELMLALGTRKWRIDCLAGWSSTEFFRGEFARARELAEESVRVSEQFALIDTKIKGLAVLAFLHTVEPESPSEAKRLADEATSVDAIPYHSRFIGLVARLVAAYVSGDYQTAWDEAPQRLKDSIEMAWLPHELVCLTVMAMLLADNGEYVRAAELFGLTLNHPASPSGWFDNWPLLMRKCKQLQDTLGTEAYATAWERGKQLTLDELINNLTGLSQPETNIRQLHAGQGLIEPLTEQELKIMQLIADGLNSREVAERLYLGVGTIRWYLKRIYDKLDVHSRSQAVARAREMKLLA